jgi:hypothetical protein
VVGQKSTPRNNRDGVNDGPYHSHINSIRGQALRALWWACEAQGKTADERRELRRTLLQGVAALKSTPQNAGAVELLHDFHEDREGAVALFVNCSKGILRYCTLTFRTSSWCSPRTALCLFLLDL